MNQAIRLFTLTLRRFLGMSTTIGDVIQAKKNADSNEATASAAAAAADKAFADAKTATASANATLKTDLALTGPVIVANTDGSFEVYMPDSTDLGFHTIKPAPATTAIPDPVPAPPSN